MKYINTFIFSIILITISGCYFDQPPGPTYVSWSKPGASELEVKKALLECGDVDPYGYDPEESTRNRRGAAGFCMERSGFRTDPPAKQFCSTFKEENYPICRPGAVIPQRSVARRLNSEYCKEWLKPENNPEVNTPECLP